MTIGLEGLDLKLRALGITSRREYVNNFVYSLNTKARNSTNHNTVDPLRDSVAACEMDEVERGFDAVVKSKNLLKDGLLSLKYSGEEDMEIVQKTLNAGVGEVEKIDEIVEPDQLHREWMMVQKKQNASVRGKKNSRNSIRGEGLNRVTDKDQQVARIVVTDGESGQLGVEDNNIFILPLNRGQHLPQLPNIDDDNMEKVEEKVEKDDSGSHKDNFVVEELQDNAKMVIVD
ncbi:hypothetical protein K2173_004657 [Erythroxylum novogranatense]|uniref:Uncharacterized protein n=1 Tax=Erythroxylum novogranatense TaxID=1862640 RepID=A0AAV8T6F3_9ROSI|nr:hypothetical protein K2173_004657 [Erythroxylum novogranatense]